MASSSSRRELQGPRPPPLTVSKASWKVKKPAAAPAFRGREPVVVYLNTPRVIHARPQDFMSLVQRLTGKSSSSSSSSASFSSAGGSGRRSLDSPTAAAAAAAGQDGVGSGVGCGGGGGDGDPLLLTLGQFSSLSSVPSPIISPSLFFCSPSAQALLQDLSPLF